MIPQMDQLVPLTSQQTRNPKKQRQCTDTSAEKNNRKKQEKITKKRSTGYLVIKFEYSPSLFARSTDQVQAWMHPLGRELTSSSEVLSSVACAPRHLSKARGVSPLFIPAVMVVESCGGNDDGGSGVRRRWRRWAAVGKADIGGECWRRWNFSLPPSPPPHHRGKK